MEKIARGLFLFWCITTASFARDYYLAVQPGIRLGWQVGSGVTISAQISFQILSPSASFIDIAIGGRQLFYRKKKVPYNSHTYLNVAFGKYYQTNPRAFTQGGLGIIFYREKGHRRIRPRGTVSGGYISLFRQSVPVLVAGSADLTAIRLQKMLLDTGTRLSLWIPARTIPY